MALIICSECGKEISDTAVRCPNCGYNVKKYIKEKKRKELLQKKQVKNRNPLNLIIKVAIIIVCVIIIVFIFIHKQREKEAVLNIKVIDILTEDISEYREKAVMKLKDGSYIYYDYGAEYAVEEIAKSLIHLEMCIEDTDKHYVKSKKAIDTKIKEVTNYGCRNWEEYRERLNTNYHIDDGVSNREQAETIVSWYVDFVLD